MPLFSKTKTPKDLIVSIRENLMIINSDPIGSKGEKERARASSELTRHLNTLKEQVSSSISAMPTSPQGSAVTATTAPSNTASRPSENAALALVVGALPPSDADGGHGGRANETLVEVTSELQQQDTLFLLLNSMDRIDFESSKYVVDLFCLLLHRQVGETRPMVNFVCKNPKILALFFSGYEKPDHAIQYGTMLREAARHEELARQLLNSPEMYKLFKHVQGTTFDVSSDAFQSLRDLLTRHKVMVSKFLEANYDKFLQHYHSMMNSENYVTKRQALKLLSELLLERANLVIMRRYIDEPENLKLIMNLLKAQEKQIAFEAFHCFKVFVANPNKSRQVTSLLFLNRDKLVEFLGNFLPDRSEDVQFCDEKAYLIKTIREMTLPPVTGNPSVPSSAATPPAASANNNNATAGTASDLRKAQCE